MKAFHYNQEIIGGHNNGGSNINKVPTYKNMGIEKKIAVNDNERLDFIKK